MFTRILTGVTHIISSSLSRHQFGVGIIYSLLTKAIDSHIVKFSADKVSMTIADMIRNQSTNGATVLIVRTMGGTNNLTIPLSDKLAEQTAANL